MHACSQILLENMENSDTLHGKLIYSEFPCKPLFRNLSEITYSNLPYTTSPQQSSTSYFGRAITPQTVKFKNKLSTKRCRKFVIMVYMHGLT